MDEAELKAAFRGYGRLRVLMDRKFILGQPNESEDYDRLRKLAQPLVDTKYEPIINRMIGRVRTIHNRIMAT